MSETIRFIDLFGGIGGFRHGLEQASNQYECVDYIEYDKYAVKSYNEIFQERHEPRDVTQLQTGQIPEHDLLCAGFPCQSFSVAGNRQGTDEARGKLFREIVRIAESHRPEMLLLENVKGILSQKVVKDGESVEGTKGHAFTEVLQALHELGYCLEWQVLNSKNWGVPQNRERVFIIGHLGGEPRRKVFPIRRENREDTGKDGRKLDIKEIGSRYDKQSGGVYDRYGISPTVTYGKRGPQPHHVVEEGLLRDKGEFRTKEKANCLDANYWKGMDNRDARTHILNLLYNPDYSYALSSSPHYCIDLRDKNRGSHEQLLEKAPTLRSQRHGISVLQLPRGQNEGGEHLICPTVSSNSWHQNNFLEEVLPVHTPGFAEKDMNMKSRVGSEDGSMFTVDGTSQHGVMEMQVIGNTVPSNHEAGNVYNPSGLAPTVRENHGKVTKTLQKKRIRKLTPKECWRLQGFPDKSFEAAQQVNSDTQLYKQAGNAVTVNVIKVLGDELVKYF